MSNSHSKRPRFFELFPFSFRDLKITLLILLVAVTICILLQRMEPSAGFSMPVFVLTVLLTSWLTNGYFWGLLSAVLGVIAVNYFFTYPFWSFNLTITGYPLSFLTFLSVSIITSTLTTKTRQLDKLRLENEKIRMRADLLRSVSHDIRTPLTSIIGSTSAVLDNPDLSTEDRRTLLQDVKQEAQWLIRVVENLLSITRIGSDQAELAKQPEPAEEVLAEAAQKARKRLPDIKFSVEVPDDLLMVPMDPILIEQVLSNLIENAVTHGVTTTAIHLSVKETEDGFAAFSVRDNGRGIPPSLLPHLFDYSIRHASTPTGDGKRNMGLGLSGVQRCRQSARRPSHGPQSQGRRGVYLLPARFQGGIHMNIREKILVIEDEKSIAHFISTILTANGYDAMRASSGAEAMSMISSHCPDLVILDLGLPDMDGLDILRQIRSWSTLPVVVVSARSHEQDKVSALDLGADDYLTKPFGTDELLARVRTAIRHTRTSSGNSEIAQQGTYTVGELTIDYNKHQVLIRGENAKLTLSEFRIVALLGKHAGRVLTYDYIIKELWGPRASGDNQILRVNMANIRRKIEKNPAEPEYLFTEVGVGYRMAESET